MPLDRKSKVFCKTFFLGVYHEEEIKIADDSQRSVIAHLLASWKSTSSPPLPGYGTSNKRSKYAT